MLFCRDKHKKTRLFVIMYLTLLFIIFGCVKKYDLQTRIYMFDEHGWKSVGLTEEEKASEGIEYSDSEASEDMKKFFCCADIDFPEGSYVRLDSAHKKIIIKNTVKSLDEIEVWMRPMHGEGYGFKQRIIIKETKNGVVAVANMPDKASKRTMKRSGGCRHEQSIASLPKMLPDDYGFHIQNAGLYPLGAYIDIYGAHTNIAYVHSLRVYSNCRILAWRLPDGGSIAKNTAYKQMIYVVTPKRSDQIIDAGLYLEDISPSNVSWQYLNPMIWPQVNGLWEKQITQSVNKKFDLNEFYKMFGRPYSNQYSDATSNCYCLYYNLLDREIVFETVPLKCSNGVPQKVKINKYDRSTCGHITDYK